MKIGADSLVRALAPARPAVLVAVLSLLCTMIAMPAEAAKPAKPVRQRLMAESPLTAFQPQIGEIGRFAFTAPGTPGLPQSLSSGFRFTPSGQAENRRALSLGVSTRVTAPVAADRLRTSLAAADQFVIPSGYGVNVSLGWKGFAINGGYSHAEPPVLTPLTLRGADAVNLGLSYGGARWRTSVEGVAEQSQMLSAVPLLRRYSVELGGLYRVAPRLSVTGGVRYRIAPEPPSILLPNRDDQAVYLGTSIAF